MYTVHKNAGLCTSRVKAKILNRLSLFSEIHTKGEKKYLKKFSRTSLLSTRYFKSLNKNFKQTENSLVFEGQRAEKSKRRTALPWVHQPRWTNKKKIRPVPYTLSIKIHLQFGYVKAFLQIISSKFWGLTNKLKRVCNKSVSKFNWTPL